MHQGDFLASQLEINSHKILKKNGHLEINFEENFFTFLLFTFRWGDEFLVEFLSLIGSFGVFENQTGK